MKTKLTLLLLALTLLASGVLFLVVGGRGSAARSPREIERRPREAVALAPLDPADAVPAQPESARAVVAREELPAEPARAQASTGDGELAGLSGRVVEEDGTPVAGLGVALLEFEASLLFDGGGIDAPQPSLERGATLTDREGRFVLNGARASAMHALGIDLGGPRATLRVIEHALVHRERADIGDVVLAPCGVLTGRVVDEDGRPVAGARVRAGPFPQEILVGHPWEFRSDSVIAVGGLATGKQGQTILEPPVWVRSQLERLPVPTTRSAADGSFRLAVALAQLVGGIDMPGYVGVPLGPLDLSDGAEELGTLVLARGRTVSGVVEDPYGEPVAGAEVLAGAEIVPGVAAILQPCGPTDAEGRFELTGVAEDGEIVAAARRLPHEPWGTAVTGDPEDVLVELGGSGSLSVHVRDEAGQPLSGARIRLRPEPPTGPGMDAGLFALLLPRPSSRAELFREVETGRYDCASLGAGKYEVTACVPGRAPATGRVECQEEGSEVTLVCSAGSPIEVRVIDARTREPVAGARASVHRVGGSGFTTLASESTDAAGCARLGPLPASAAEEEELSWIPAETIVAVQHPRYGDHSAELAPGTTSLVVELETGGTLAGRVHCAGALPTRLYMLSLEPETSGGFLEIFRLPRFTLTDLAGEFRCAGLEAGTYQIGLKGRFLDRDPLGLLVEDDVSYPEYFRGEVEIQNGETTELVIDLTPTGRGPTARIVGSVRVDGRSLEGADVNVFGNENVHVRTDAGGRFETPAFSIQGDVQVVIEGELEQAKQDGAAAARRQLHSESLALAPDEIRALDLDLHPSTVRVQVVEAPGGEPVAGAQVTLGPASEWSAMAQEGETDASGETALLVTEPGEYRIRAIAPGFGRSSATITVTAEDQPEPVQLRLTRAVPCGGRVQIDAPAAGEERRFVYLEIRSSDDSDTRAGVILIPPDYTFSADDLGTGRYDAWVHVDDRTIRVGSFELGPYGARDLVLVPEPSDE